LDRPCGATEVAAADGVAAALAERSSYGKDFDRLTYTNDVIDILESHGVDLVVMAGFGTIFEKSMFDAYEGRIINTHPALLPAFPGWHAVRDTLAAGVKVTGVTVHVATLEVDAGPILAQESVPVLPGDDEKTLHERIKDVERRLYPATIKAIIERGSVQA
jgi:phosphoribosylglycinamide formyltransferase-1